MTKSVFDPERYDELHPENATPLPEAFAKLLEGRTARSPGKTILVTTPGRKNEHMSWFEMETYPAGENPCTIYISGDNNEPEKL